MSTYRFFCCALLSTLLWVSGCAQNLKSEGPLAVVNASEAAPKNIIRHIIFASDPQYPWSKDEKNAEDGLGASPHQKSQDVPLQSRSSVNQVSDENLFRNQYNAIQKWRTAAMGGVGNNPVIINGDMTAYGHGWQRSFLYGALDSILSTNWYFGLGNHDYKNNVGGCLNNGCARDSMNDLIGRMGGNNMDYSTNHGGGFPETKRYSGSFGYYKDFGKVRYIQLNLDPSYTQWFYSNGATVFKSKYEFNIQSPVQNTWLERVLINARDQKKFIIIGMHDPGEWTYSSDARSAAILTRFRQLLKIYDVSAIFAGHFHSSAGKYQSVYGDVPVFLSGSATDETFLIVDIDESTKAFQTWLVNNNNPQNAKHLGSMYFKHSVVVPPVDEYDNTGHWGNWGVTASCSSPNYINGFSIRAQSSQGSGDDTAVNAIAMHCFRGSELHSNEGNWGHWYEYALCPSNEAVVGYQLKMQPSQGSGNHQDDTAVDSVRLFCEGGGYLPSPYDTPYGIWKKAFRCPAGMVATGFETRVEVDRGNNDDSTLNGMRMRCDPKP
ncbi:metallophosphoesterase [Pseudomonas coronafaciens]|uniref:metallophosphoesterase n=2 Tax=Pseudomonas coronafaciens TaxID=53409 RepID=UPI000EFEE715|nr:metallophosphoesterase [Pseudomonas coronafaciens]RMS91806.1 VOMI protein [Pseudomonas coronafaciens pv. oryzae]RMT00637.1 VOMI protein [Pseudomonas coronafaciens pv. oryzae]